MASDLSILKERKTRRFQSARWKEEDLLLVVLIMIVVDFQQQLVVPLCRLTSL